MNRLKGKNVVVTGAAQGIGEAITKLLAAEGAVVIICDINYEAISELASNIPNVSACKLDVTNETEWQSFSDEMVNRFGHIDVLINNAGITGNEEGFGPQNPEDINLGDWQKVHNVNLDGVLLGCKYGIKTFLAKNKSSSIVNLSSRGGLVGVPHLISYASSKAAVTNLSKSVALYCADKKYNIRCNSIHPAAIHTKMTESFLGNSPDERKERLAFLENSIPLHRLGQPEEVAQLVLFLASDESSFITGSEIRIDGGSLSGAPSVSKFDD